MLGVAKWSFAVEAGEMQAIADTLMRVVTPDMTPKQLTKAAMKAHPNASKKDIACAAFFSIIATAGPRQGQEPAGVRNSRARSRRLLIGSMALASNQCRPNSNPRATD
ncbi:hypothetical protein [Mesorhizobium sp.]|uniref:hypothetical protein n=1 Tax=Mesorhizobium sp. TaxID=1871066 RepID=UPI00257E89CD|nr:hypothetical protein [Mesorhizobium sp.]